MGKNRTHGAEQEAPLSPTSDVRRVRMEVVLDRARQGLLIVALGSGLQVLATMLEQDREEVCAPRSKQGAERHAYRYGYDEGTVVMGSRKVRYSPGQQAASARGRWRGCRAAELGVGHAG